MPIDTSMYSMIKAPDIAGGIQDGMRMRDMIDQRGRQQKLDAQNDQKFQMEKADKARQYVASVYSNIKDDASLQSAIKGAQAIGLPVDGFTGRYEIDKPILDNLYASSMSREQQESMALQKERFGYEKNKDSRDYDLRYRDTLAKEKLAGMDAQRKATELNATEAKLLGNYEIGTMAEQQYKNAVADPNEYNPTESGQFIDNDTSGWVPNSWKNKKAVEANAAKSSWVETFLRTDSGAAIPPDERLAYAKDYFPQPGDTPQVIANKELLRKQKMQNALVGSGYNGQKMAQQEQQVKQAAQQNMSNVANAVTPKILKTNQIKWKQP